MIMPREMNHQVSQEDRGAALLALTASANSGARADEV
jgi:hypothetical protein